MEIRPARRQHVAELPGAWRSAIDEGPASATWRLRIRMEDHPGMLARIAIRMADLECNILGLAVLPVPGGVLDEVVIRPASGLTKEQLIRAIQDEGCECSAIADADVHELVDPSAAAFTAASRAVDDPSRYAEVLREVLAADLVTVVPLAEANPARTEGGHRATFAVDGATALVARRRWSPFVQLELARAEALLGLLDSVRANVAGQAVATLTDGTSIVLRQGQPGDADALSALHERCSTETLFQRYHTGMSTMPRRWLHRLLMPPRGMSVLAVCGREVIGLGQLIPGTGEIAEISLLVDDSWQRMGVGTALMARLAVIAASRGHRRLLAVSLPGRDGIFRTARRAGLAPDHPEEEGLLRITIPAALTPRPRR
ncbi:GNAT family N-acetyltransferase [Amycolatopsis alkalitolerans]|uniref:GNAT family N-acetyltransferase n=1 Tax=Amycolatopsis alkalitolerans TaxID=2547244 RepID=A0A5C4LZU2_9PSEU|nr:GNAT family N-acetyltransferase [Amycolatopsis alkalitolerans]TNC23970.1 GNAT family N-acetyltransferase [Amycolatopsis alkalitolerans]